MSAALDSFLSARYSFSPAPIVVRIDIESPALSRSPNFHRHLDLISPSPLHAWIHVSPAVVYLELVDSAWLTAPPPHAGTHTYRDSSARGCAGSTSRCLLSHRRGERQPSTLCAEQLQGTPSTNAFLSVDSTGGTGEEAGGPTRRRKRAIESERLLDFLFCSRGALCLMRGIGGS